MLKFQKKFTSSFCAHKKRDAGQNPGATKITLPLRARDKNYPCEIVIFGKLLPVILTYRVILVQIKGARVAG